MQGAVQHQAEDINEMTEKVTKLTYKSNYIKSKIARPH